MSIYSYCRVSREEQNLERQEEAVKKYCQENNITIDKEFSDKISGKTFERKEYLEMKSIVKKGDVIIVKELDRLGRNYDLIKEEWNYFLSNDVGIIIIDMPTISTYSNDNNKTLERRFISNMVFEILCYVSEKEREKLSQRTKEALAVKKSNGVKLGRPNTYSQEFIDKIIEERKNGAYLKELSQKYGVSVDRIRIWSNQNGIGGMFKGRTR